jgi:hypothetical protein
MVRLIALLGFSLLCGCNPAGGAIQRQPGNNNERAVDSLPPVSAFRLNDARQITSLDTRVAPQQRRRFDIGLGSVTLEMMHVTDNKLTFRYTPEVEGGYTIYECTVSVSPTLVEIQIASDGTPRATSFDLAACKVIRQGSVNLK